jgi:hypothetical protein
MKRWSPSWLILQARCMAEARSITLSSPPAFAEGATVLYPYGSKKDVARRLVATFASEQQLLAYVRWATLSGEDHGTAKFEEGSALAGYTGFEYSSEPLTDDDETQVAHNPTPSIAAAR